MATKKTYVTKATNPVESMRNNINNLGSEIVRMSTDIEMTKKANELSENYGTTYMMASDLVKNLISVIAKFGDVPVFIEASNNDDEYVMKNINSIGYGKVKADITATDEEGILRIIMQQHGKGTYAAISYTAPDEFIDECKRKKMVFDSPIINKNEKKATTTTSKKKTTSTTTKKGKKNA